MTPSDLLAQRKTYLLKHRRSPTEARMHPHDIVDIAEALLLPPDRVFGMRLIADDQERGKPMLGYSRIDS